MRRSADARLGHWLTDRHQDTGGWKGDADPLRLIERGVTPILCATHPNNWSSSLGVLRDRGLRACLPDARLGTAVARPIRSGKDAPLL